MNTPEASHITSVLEKLAAAYRDRDADRYLSCFAEQSLVFGTGADEKCRGLSEIRAHLERDWAQSTSASFVLREPCVVCSGRNAWVAADCDFAFQTSGGDGAATGRVSFFLEQVKGEWLIHHAHFSLPAPSGEGQSF